MDGDERLAQREVGNIPSNMADYYSTQQAEYIVAQIRGYPTSRSAVQKLFRGESQELVVEVGRLLRQFGSDQKHRI
ncbi:hypothetical protein DEO72_LG2g3314 [Vigna unguiculata]|uniref:Uncharacterized protein n=1 Tax=Vigna unguiculata TaxID=3917 RepID=A0A4D6L382_VIGUN|nr:hypothetical protein DEO72_LG2g3314 [Vigna unguiculata]